MMDYILLGISLCFGTAKNLIAKAGEDIFAGTKRLMLTNIITSLVALAIFGVQGLDFSRIIDPAFLLMAFLYGICTMSSQSLYILAVNGGSVSICALIYASCFLIPTVFSAVYDREPVSVMKITGIAALIVSIALVSLRGKRGHAIDKKHLLLALLSMCAAGGTGILQKLSVRQFPGQTNEFLFAAFAFMLIQSGGVLLLRSPEKKGYSRKYWIYAVLLALSVVIASRLNMHLAGALPGMMFFPVINGGTIMLTALVSGALFRDRLPPSVWGGIIISVIAMVMISL